MTHAASWSCRLKVCFAKADTTRLSSAVVVQRAAPGALGMASLRLFAEPVFSDLSWVEGSVFAHAGTFAFRDIRTAARAQKNADAHESQSASDPLCANSWPFDPKNIGRLAFGQKLGKVTVGGSTFMVAVRRS